MSDLFNAPSERRHEIDWLRSLAFILLIFYHIGMFYVADWGWHVKSEYQSTFLQSIMLMVNPWRMPLIFFLSGFALYLIEPKIGALKLIQIRFVRIFIPLVFAMYTILIPQPFFEAVQNHGYTGNIWQFTLVYINPNTQLLEQMQHGPAGLLTWNHLWYLVYLWVYTFLYLLVRPILPMVSVLMEKSMPALCWLLILIVALTVIETYLEPIFPVSNALVDDWYNHARYFLVFLVGNIIARSKSVYRKIVDNCWAWVSAVLPLYGLSMVLKKTSVFEINTAFEAALATFCFVSNALVWLFAAVALSGRFLTHKNKVLAYLNQAVLPWYILHQSVIIVVAMALAPQQLGGFVEPILVIFGTLAACATLYEGIKRWNPTRFLFGMKLIRD